jgi:MFS family permease
MGKLGRRLGISVGFLLSVAGTLLCAVALLRGLFSLFLLGALINGFGRGTGEQSRYAAADIVPPERSARAIGTIVFAGTIGAVMGPLLLAPSERAADMRGIIALSGPYFMTAALSFISFAIIFLFLRPEPMLYARLETVGMPVAPGRSIRTIFADRTVQLAVFALGISQLVMTMIMVITPLHMAHENHTTQAVSWVIMAHTLGMFGLSGVTGWLTARCGPRIIIAAGGLVLAVSAIIAPLAATVPMLAVALFLLGLGWNLGYVAGSALLAGAVSPGERGQTQGISETLVAVAAAAGSFSTGPAFQRGGFIAVSMIGLALAVALLAAQAASLQRRNLPAAAD